MKDTSLQPAATVSTPVVAGRIVLVSAMRNEAPFLLEWVAYHKAIGIDEIVICSNPSTDGTDELLEALAGAGEITWLRTKPGRGESPQAAAVKAFESRIGYRSGDWFIWLDADEFLNVHVGDRTAKALVAALGDASGVMLNWRLFGSGGQQTFPGRHLGDAFTGAARPRLAAHRETKSLFRYGGLVAGFAEDAIGRPRLVDGSGATAKDFLAGSGAPLKASEPRTVEWLAGVKAKGRTNLSTWGELGWTLAQINHYSVRTPDFFRLKATRGRGAASTGPLRPNARHTDSYFRRFDRNESQDRSILFWEQAVTDGIDRMRQTPEIAGAEASAMVLVAKELETALQTRPDFAATMGNATLDAVSASAAASRPRRVLFSAMKNEAPFILEWVAYHKAIGFDDIVICSNPSNDGTEEVLAAMAKAGHITHLQVTVPDGASPQYVATQAFEREVGLRDGDWYMWLDADEFLNVHVGDGTVTALIYAMGDKQIALINWRIFGSSGQTAFPGRFIDAAFTGAAKPDFPRNNALKSFFRHSPAIGGFARHGIHRPLIAGDSTLTLDDVLVGNGKSPAADNKVHARWLRGKDSVFTNQVTPDEAGWALAQVNHYIVRTRDLYQLKRVRGRGYVPKVGIGSPVRHDAEFFAHHDRNEAEDRSILRWQDAVTAGIAAFMKQRGIATAVRAAERKSKAELAAALAQPLALSAPVTPATPASGPVRRKPAQGGVPRRVLFSAMKNEAPFLLEWVAYHKAIGFDDIVICSNPSNDGTEEVLAALAAAGEITHLQATVPEGASPQYMATQAFEREVGFRDGDWYLWLDADEFLNVHVGDRTVGALVDAIGDKQAALINWRIFGSSGHTAFPGRFVSDAFTGAADQKDSVNSRIKTIFRFGRAFRGFAQHGIHRPRVLRDSGLAPEDVLSGSGQPISTDFKIERRWLKGDDFVQCGRVPPAEFGWALAQINHYCVRTADYFALKSVRGRGYMPRQKVVENNRHTQEFFRAYDRNEAKDSSILHWQDAVTEEIAGFMEQKRVADAVHAAERMTRAQLAALRAKPVELPTPMPTVEPTPAPAVPARRKLAEGEAPRRILFSAMKNEAPFLLEWVAYHKAIGFDDIVICSNPSNDGTEELLAALAQSGEITHLQATVPKGASPQYMATQAFERDVGFRDGDWYMWLDADEFLNVHVGDRTVGALIDAMGDKQVGLINWRIFGSSGHKAFPGRFVDPAFPGAATPNFPLNFALKAIFRCSPAIRGFARHGIHRPRIARKSGLGPEDVLLGSGKTPSTANKIHRRWLEGDDIVRTSRVTPAEFGWTLAQINHYIVRTQDYFILKALRGRGYMPRQKVKTNNRHTPKFFAEHDRNEAEDRSILHWQKPVSDEIARLTQVPAIAEAAALATTKVEQIMAQINDPAAAAPATEVEPAPAPTFKLTFPAAERSFVTEAYAKAGLILEYGSGGSTVLAAKSGARVIAVESDKAWGARLSETLAKLSDKAHVHYVDIGPTADWGKPKTNAAYARFPNYALSVWDRPDLGDPDLVLIDGRFRAACLAAVKMRTRQPVTVLFDDYVARKYYRGVEKLAVKEQVIGRMARFTVTPGPIPPEMLTQVIGWFSDPR